MNIYCYIIFYIIMFALALYAIKLDCKKRNYIFLLICFSFFLFYGFRDGMVGYDTKTYTRYYNSQSAESYVSVERLFYYLAVVFWTLHIPTKIYIAFLTLLVIILNGIAYYVAFKDDNKYLCISYVGMMCLPYAIMMNINVVRQGIAISTLLLAMVLCDKNKKVLATIVAIVGCMFHYMGFMILIAYVVLYLLKTRKNKLMFSIVWCIVGIVVGTFGIGEYILNQIPNNSLTKRVLCYMDESVTNAAIVRLVFYFAIALGMIAVIVFCNIEVNNVVTLFLAIFMMTGVGVSCMTVAHRTAMSMDIFIPLILLNPATIQELEEKSGALRTKRYVHLVVIFCVMMYIFGIFCNPVKANLGF